MGWERSKTGDFGSSIWGRSRVLGSIATEPKIRINFWGRGQGRALGECRAHVGDLWLCLQLAGCNLRLSEVRFEPVWGPLGLKPAPNRFHTTPTRPWTTSICCHMTCSHIHRSPTIHQAAGRPPRPLDPHLSACSSQRPPGGSRRPPAWGTCILRDPVHKA